MCGIFGFVGLEDGNQNLLNRMGDILVHRGPDDVGYFCDKKNKVAFGLRRLSIIDIEGGHQPLSNEDKTIWAACNGEIYNYRELRKDLIDKGHRFSSASDVEALVHLYEDEGLGFLEKVNGMFGFILFDGTKKRIILARDRLGIKPVYYSWNGKILAFASEIKPLLSLPWISWTPSMRNIYTYLELGYIPAPYSCFQDIKKLESGCLLVLENGNFQIRKYWNIMDYTSKTSSLDYSEASEYLRFLLEDSVNLQLRSDVPVGAFLSGGIDSTAVVSLAHINQHNSPMDTYTIAWCNTDEKTDERPFAEKIANRYHSNHHQNVISFDDFIQYMPLLAWHLEEPYSDGAYVPTYLISLLASKNVKVILTGVGGDELFAGYAWYHDNFSFRNIIKRLINPHRWSSEGYEYGKRTLWFPWRFIFPEYTSYSNIQRIMETYKVVVDKDKVNAQMAHDIKIWLQDNILALTDKMSMATSVEARVPLLDHRIVEFSLSLPSSFKINKGDSKIIFKNVLTDLLPHEILNRRKDGFGVPIVSWMKDEKCLRMCLRLIKNGEMLKLGILSEKSINRLFTMVNFRKRWLWAVWSLLNLEMWFRFVYKNVERPVGVSLNDL